MAHSCPINFERVDATTIRIISLLVMSTVVLHIIVGSPLILLLLVIDFMIRLYADKNYSLTYRVASWIQNSLKLEPKYEDAGAKRLASHFGLLFTLLLLSASILELPVAFYTIAGIFLGCASLEVLFGFCVGCKVYFIIQKLLPKH
jgi:hypothetical protein